MYLLPFVLFILNYAFLVQQQNHFVLYLFIFFFLLFQAPIFTFNFDLQLETTLFWKIIFCSNVTVQVFLFIFFFFLPPHLKVLLYGLTFKAFLK
jgi:hypothetical protein